MNDFDDDQGLGTEEQPQEKKMIETNANEAEWY